MTKIYDFKVNDYQGNKVSLEKYKGKVMLIVNTATGCGFTPQYEGLQKIYLKYQKDGFEILDFPCNQFADQAKESNEEIHEFCLGKFAMTFDQFEKIDVNGENADPLFNYLTNEKSGLLSKKIKWNFTKFLVDKEGNVVTRFAPVVKPEQIEKHIKNLL